MRSLGFVLLAIAGCGSSSVTQQSATAACITANACGIPLSGGVGDVATCTQYVPYINSPENAVAARFTPAQVDCIASAGSNCAAARKCLAGGQTPAACPTSGESCDGDTWQSCTSTAGSGGSFGVRTFDCAAYGQRCVAIGGSADCAVGNCMPEPGICVTADGTVGGNFVEACYGSGWTRRRDCGLLAASCDLSGLYGGHCRGNGATCTAPSAGDDTLGCDGNVLLHCLDGQQAREDCGRYKLGCFARLSGGGFGCAAGNDCDPSTTVATCNGKALTFCANGKMQTFDCGAAGFATCDVHNGPSCGT